MNRQTSYPSTRRATLARVVLLCSCLSAGCKVGPDYIAPEVAMPDAWQQVAIEGVEGGESHIHTWWTQLGDPVFEGLIERAAMGNLDLEIAFTRIHQARAVRGIATGERFPDVNGVGSATRQRLSEGQNPFVPPDLGRTDNYYNLGVEAGWEIDLWGRISRSIESADAGVQATVENYRDVLVVLFAEVGVTYIEVRALQARIASLEGNVETQQTSLKLTMDRHTSGLAPELDVRWAELNLATTESSLPTLRQFLARSIYRLGVLLGEHPGALVELLSEPAPIPTPPDEILLGVPAEILRQRPDIRRAERELASRTAEVGVATADLYPTFSLVGTFGFASTSQLLEAGNRAWSFGPQMFWNIFDGGRVRNQIELRNAEVDEALARYEQTVLLALEDVEGAMVGYVEETRRLATLERAVAAAQRASDLVLTLYRTGLTDFQNVQDSERNLFIQMDELAASRGAVVQNLIDIYRALGGGWQPAPEVLVQELEDQENGEPRF